MVNLFGKGFIGSRYAELHPCVVNERNDIYPKSREILYFISTIDNHTFKTNPYIDIETNLITLMKVLDQCKNNSVTFNFISSWFVYGSGENVKENHICNPKGFYSITKRTAEQLLVTYCKEFNINYRILRLANVLGTGDKKSSPRKNVLSYIIKRIKNDENVELHSGGNFYRSYIHINDVCSAINLVINKGEKNQIYNIGAYHHTLLDAVKYAVTKTQSKSKINIINNTEVDTFTMNLEKLNQLGFNPKYSFTDILDELIDEKYN